MIYPLDSIIHLLNNWGQYGTTKVLSTLISVLFELTDIFFRFVLPSTRMNSVKTVTENASFQKRSPEWRFLKKPASRLRVYGRKRSFSNTMMSYIMFFYHAIVFRSF